MSPTYIMAINKALKAIQPFSCSCFDRGLVELRMSIHFSGRLKPRSHRRRTARFKPTAPIISSDVQAHPGGG